MQFANGQKTWKGISPNRITDGKYIEKCSLKPQGGITQNLPEVTKKKIVKTSNARKYAEKLDGSYTTQLMKI